jgi:hypothetical protein
MILESAQLLCTAHRVLDDNESKELYKSTHKNHPCARWTRESSGNYMWLHALFVELLKEYTFRYDKHHSCERLVERLSVPPLKIISGDVTTPEMAMPDIFKVPDDPVLSYRRYYTFGKTHLHSWKRREIPSFVNSLKTSGFKNPMANFVESAFTFTVKFAADLKDALAINPDLDIQEFTKPYFGFPTSPIVVNVAQKKSKTRSIVPGKERAKGKAGKGQGGKGKCTATTAKGAQCSKCAKDGELFCSIHLKKTSPKSSSAPSKKDAKKVVPQHTHAPSVKPNKGDCKLCDTHGDGIDKEQEEEEVQFEVEDDVESTSDRGDDGEYQLGEDDFDE